MLKLWVLFIHFSTSTWQIHKILPSKIPKWIPWTIFEIGLSSYTEWALNIKNIISYFYSCVLSLSLVLTINDVIYLYQLPLLAWWRTWTVEIRSSRGSHRHHRSTARQGNFGNRNVLPFRHLEQRCVVRTTCCWTKLCLRSSSSWHIHGKYKRMVIITINIYCFVLLIFFILIINVSYLFIFLN